MMGTTNAVVLSGVIVTAGRWAEGNPLEAKVIVGGTFLTVGLAVLGSANEKLAQQFGLLILTVSVLRYIVPIIQKTHITDNNPKVGKPVAPGGMFGGGWS